MYTVCIKKFISSYLRHMSALYLSHFPPSLPTCSRTILECNLLSVIMIFQQSWVSRNPPTPFREHLEWRLWVNLLDQGGWGVSSSKNLQHNPAKCEMLGGSRLKAPLAIFGRCHSQLVIFWYPWHIRREIRCSTPGSGLASCLLVLAMAMAAFGGCSALTHLPP